jgi:hypothetical protein
MKKNTQTKELIPRPLLLGREGELKLHSKVPLFLREGFRVSYLVYNSYLLPQRGEDNNKSLIIHK